jgi:hypothetical protein
LYSIPQKTKLKVCTPLGVQPIGQTSISKHLGITQSRVQQITKDKKKVYIFTEVPEHNKLQSQYFNNKYVYTIKNLGIDKNGEYKKDKQLQLIGSKLLGTLNYKSYVQGTDKKGKFNRRKLSGLSNASSMKNYKLMAPKKHSQVDKLGVLVGFSTDYMSKTALTTAYSNQSIMTYQIVADSKEKAIQKLNTEFRIEEMYNDIAQVSSNDILSHSNKSLDTRINIAYKLIGRLYYQKLPTDWLYTNFKNLMYHTHNNITKYKEHKIKHKNIAKKSTNMTNNTIISTINSTIDCPFST